MPKKTTKKAPAKKTPAKPKASRRSATTAKASRGPTKRMSPEERAAKEAYDVEAKIKKGTGAIKVVQIAIAGYLHDFHSGRMWESLGYDKFETWLGSPEISMGRSDAYQKIEVYEELVVKRDVSQVDLAELDMSKLAVVLPALRKDEIELEGALSDCEALSRSELRAKYGQSVPAKRIPLTECEECGKMCRLKTEPEESAEDPNQLALEEANSA